MGYPLSIWATGSKTAEKWRTRVVSGRWKPSAHKAGAPCPECLFGGFRGPSSLAIRRIQRLDAELHRIERELPTMAIKRRQFLAQATAASAGVAASALAKPAIAQQRLEWKMVTSWPKGLAGVATGAERLAQRIGDLSGGQLTVKVYAAGELVPALQVLDAVSSGTAEM